MVIADISEVSRTQGVSERERERERERLANRIQYCMTPGL
jgi:hypothetical protein